MFQLREYSNISRKTLLASSSLPSLTSACPLQYVVSEMDWTCIC